MGGGWSPCHTPLLHFIILNTGCDDPVLDQLEVENVSHDEVYMSTD